MMSQKHEFALYYPQSPDLTVNYEFIITDADLIHRIINILRLAPGETIILFTRELHIQVQLAAITKKNIVCMILAQQKNVILQPTIHWLLPILEREAFEQALYALCVMGITTIQPIITEKSRRSWGGQKDYERAERIMIAAAEQSKQFVLPLMQPVQKLAAATTIAADTQLFFDTQGKNCFEVMQDVRTRQVFSLTVCIGPEGDLTEAEKKFLRSHNFIFCRLTPTILRACDAVIVGAGIIRSLV